MRDIKSHSLLYFKGLMFLFGGIMSAAIILLEHPHWRTALVLAASIWCFCRAYYFAFYVIEHYIDKDYKFAGLSSFLLYLLRKPTKPKDPNQPQDDTQGDT